MIEVVTFTSDGRRIDSAWVDDEEAAVYEWTVHGKNVSRGPAHSKRCEKCQGH
jgi:hypothetical protein